MKRRVIGAVMLLAIAGAACTSERHAGSFESSRACIEASYDFQTLQHGRCERINDGDWQLFMPGASSGPGEGAFMGFFMFALLWAAVPPFIGASIASKEGTSVGLAVTLCIFLGWAGLAIVYYGSDRSRREMTLGTIDRAFGGVEPSPAPDVADRLRQLDELHARGVVTDAERARRRTAILDEI